MNDQITAADVKAIREMSGRDQADFGGALGGLSERTIRGWEKGALIPESQQQLLRASRAALIGGEALAFWGRDFAGQLRGESS